MSHLDAYHPDPPYGLAYADFRTARARFLARLSEQAEIARLERAFAMSGGDASAGAADLRGDEGGSEGASGLIGGDSG